MNKKTYPFKNAAILLTSLLLCQAHGVGTWREQVPRLLPFTKASKLEKLEQQKRKELTQTLDFMSDRELVILDLELGSKFYGADTVKEMKELVGKEINDRIFDESIYNNGRGEFLQILDTSLKARLDSILKNPETSPHFFEFFEDAVRKNYRREYRNILKEFFLANFEEIMALESSPEQLRTLNNAIYSFDVSIKILQETLDRTESADQFLAAFDANAIFYPDHKDQKALKRFFTANAEKLEQLLSAEQVELIHFFTDNMPRDFYERAIINETHNATKAWNYLRKALLMMSKGEGDGAKFFITFLQTWPRYLTLVSEKTGNNLLHLVATYGDTEDATKIADFLLNAGLELEAQNKRGETALFIIGKENIFSTLFDYLKKKGANTNVTDLKGNTMLHFISNAHYPSVSKIKKAIKYGISPYQKNHKGLSPLMLHKDNLIDRTEEIEKLWRRYVQEKDEALTDDLDLVPAGRGREKMPSKMFQCHDFFSVLFKRKKVDW